MPSSGAQREAIAKNAKVELPKSNSKQTRNANPPSQAQGSMGPPPIPNRNLKASGKQTNGHPTLNDLEYEDYSESTKGSIVQVKDSQLDANGYPIRFQYQNSGAQHRPEPIEEGSDSGSEGSGEEYEEEREEEGAPNEESQLVGDAEFDEEMSQQFRDWEQQMQNNFNTGAQSYPTTTSGPPTVGKHDEEEQQPPQPDAMRRQNYASQRQQQQQPATMPQMSTSRHNRAVDAMYQTQPQPVQGANPAHRSGKVVSRQPQLGVSNLPHRDPSPVFGQSTAPARGLVNPSAQKQMTQQPFQQQGVYYGTPAAIQPTGYPAASTGTLQPVAETPNDTKQQEFSLDYDHDTLIKMNYDDLRNQSLDEDPRIDHKAVSKLFPANTSTDLAERMKAAKRFEERDQATFFDSLTLDEWEKGGDWFLEQFGSILGRMRQARRHKREVAAEFEAEVHKRHDAVESKKRCIQEALKSMRSSGENVLPTPKKRRTTREGTASSIN